MSFDDADLLDPETHAQPECLYAWLRDEAPLFWDRHAGLWAVSRYEDVVFVSKHPELFCSGKGVIPNLPLELWSDEAMINRDGEAHTTQRALVSRGFTPRRVEDLQGYAVATVDRLIDSFAARGRCDLVGELARPLPMRMIGWLLGYPESLDARLLDLADIYTHAASGPQCVNEEVSRSFLEFVQTHVALVAQRKAQPGDDLLSAWLAAEIDGKKLSDSMILYEHNLLLVGGSETTRHAIALGLRELLRNKAQWEALRSDPSLVANAVEEMIRWATPFIRMRRTLTQDFEMHGRVMHAGDQVVLLYAAANRDPRVFDEPLRFDVRRVFKKPVLSFGYGKHFCLGAALARMEIRVCLERLLARVPDLALDPDRPALRRPSSAMNALVELHARFEPFEVRHDEEANSVTGEAANAEPVGAPMRCPFHNAAK